MKYNIPVNINKNITLHKSVTAVGENNRQQEIKNITLHKSVTAAGENICQQEIKKQINHFCELL